MWKNLSLEYRRGGLFHLLVSGVEILLIKLLSTNLSIYKYMAPHYYRWRASTDVLQYDCPPDRFKVEWVDPESIKYMSRRKPCPYWKRRVKFGKVMGGDWDRQEKRFSESSIYQSMYQRYQLGMDWEETQKWEEVSPKTDKEVKSLMLYLDNIDKLYRTIKDEGFRTQEEILKPNEYPNEGLYLDHLNEITVDIGRNGILLFVDGRHRLAIAKILDLDKVPVVFLVRHIAWMEARERYCSNPPNEIPNHPDLRDLNQDSIAV